MFYTLKWYEYEAKSTFVLWVINNEKHFFFWCTKMIKNRSKKTYIILWRRVQSETMSEIQRRSSFFKKTLFTETSGTNVRQLSSFIFVYLLQMKFSFVSFFDCVMKTGMKYSSLSKEKKSVPYVDLAWGFYTLPLRKKCPNTELFLVRIWTIFTQCTVRPVSLTINQWDLAGMKTWEYMVFIK